MNNLITVMSKFAADACDQGGTEPTTGLPRVCASSGSVTTVLQLVLGAIAAMTVIYIIVAGIKLMTSQGDPQQIAKARQSIIFAVIGLVIVLSAEIIVTFVIGRL